MGQRTLLSLKKQLYLEGLLIVQYVKLNKMAPVGILQ